MIIPRTNNIPLDKYNTATKYRPIDELRIAMTRLEFLIDKAQSNTHSSSTNDLTFSDLLRSDRQRPARNRCLSPSSSSYRASFLPFDPHDEEEFVELLRRIAEIVARSERRAARALISQKDDTITSIWGTKTKSNNDDDLRHYLAVFDHFCERNGLALIVGIVTGSAFSPSSYDEDGDLTAFHRQRLLPPLSIATQGVQSIAILIQNISRTTSLYYLLSNNRVNELIGLPLELYTEAERHAMELNNAVCSTTDEEEEGGHDDEWDTSVLELYTSDVGVAALSQNEQRPSPLPSNENGNSTTRRLSSLGMVSVMGDTTNELVNHFVSFLKTLSTRLNGETLQFFLFYKDGRDRVNFSLYERALEFCQMDHDYFVRVHAMNICLNILRLVIAPPSPIMKKTITTTTSDDGPAETAVDIAPVDLTESDRSIIARHVCDQLRVRRLVSPILSRLELIRGNLETAVRGLDDLDTEEEGESERDEKERDVQRHNFAGEVVKAMGNLQDELLMLDDILKVGIPSVNKYTIEILLVIFIYPLLLQPLTSYHDAQQNPVPESEDETSQTSTPRTDAATVKTALFTLACLFQNLTNHDILRALFTIILHPLTVLSLDEIKSAQPNPYRRMFLSFLSGDTVGEPTLSRSLQKMSVRLMHAAVCALSGLRQMNNEDDGGGGGILELTGLERTMMGEEEETDSSKALSARCITEILTSLSMAIANGSVDDDGAQRLSYDVGAAHALMLIIGPCRMVNDGHLTKNIACRLLVLRRRELSLFLTRELFPALLQNNNHKEMLLDEEHLNETIDRVLRDDDDITLEEGKGKLKKKMRRRSVIDSFDLVRRTESDDDGNETLCGRVRVAKESKTSDILGTLLPCRRRRRPQVCDEKEDVGEEGRMVDKAYATRLQCAKPSAMAYLQFDALVTFIENVSPNVTIVNQKTFTSCATLLNDDLAFDQDGYITAPLSSTFHSALLRYDKETHHPNLTTAQIQMITMESSSKPVIDLTGLAYFPFVFQVSDDHYDSYFADSGKVCMVANGVRWQTLYLVVMGGFMLLVDPLTTTATMADTCDKGTILSSCHLSNLTVEKDEFQHDESQICKFLINHSSLESTTPPPLFTAEDNNDTTLEDQNKTGQSSERIRQDDHEADNDTNTLRSHICCWFGNDEQAKMAYDALYATIAKGRSERGKRFREVLIQHATAAVAHEGDHLEGCKVKCKEHTSHAA